MLNKLWLSLLAVGILLLSPQLALCDEILVKNADAVWDMGLSSTSNVMATIDEVPLIEENADLNNLPLTRATEIPILMLGEGVIVNNASAILNLTLAKFNCTPIPDPTVPVTKYVDAFSYFLVAKFNCTPIPDPKVPVTKYADAFSYFLGDKFNCTPIPDPTVMVTKYADTFMYESLEPPFIDYFDTGKGTYPSMPGTHKGTIKPAYDITATMLYTYACPGTGGHSKSIHLYENGTLLASGVWTGYGSDWHNITLTSPITLQAGHTYNYTIKTGSYPQIIHADSKVVTGGTITCTEFEDANHKRYENWIPAIKLY